ncbi:MAG: hypothetical protein PHP25_00920 [Candidatus Moranbacteria bacterium]|nr:hypothetical protein [Candidatus Moranbacteria bacterium]
MPKQYYFDLKAFAGTAEFASLVIEHGNVRAAVLASDWYAEVSRHPNFQGSRQCEVWIRRMVKSWRTQQMKRSRLEWLAANPRVASPRPKPKNEPSKKSLLKEKPRALQTLSRNCEVYVVCTNSLSPAIAHQRLLMQYDAASELAREKLARRIQAVKTLIRAKVFVGRIMNNKFAESPGRFEWNTDFKGAIFEVQFEADGFKSAWKARMISSGICNTVKGWRRHFIHRKSKMPVRFNGLIAAKLKESGKSHLIRDLGFARKAA